MTTPIRSEPVATSAPGQPTTFVPTEATHKRIEQERDNAGDDWTVIQTFRDYAAGTHPQTLTAGQQDVLRMLSSSAAGRGFADNLCKVVLRAVTDRLAVERFTVEPTADTKPASESADAVATYLERVMTRNGGGALQARVHYAAVRDGNTAVSLRWDNERQSVRIRPEPWWDGATGVWVAYDGDGEPEYAVRDWQLKELVEVNGQLRYSDVQRRVIWWPDRIERYRKSGQGWQPAPQPGEPETGIVPWLRPNTDQPLHIPIVHFAANADDDHPYGVSDLAGGVLSLQDELNDIQRSVTGAARHAGFPMYFGSGIASPRPTPDTPNPPPTITVEPGLWVTVANPDARAVVLPAGEIGPLLDAYRLKLQAICRMTSTPIHEITGEWPSGEALLRAEIGLVQRGERLQDLFTGAWTTVPHRATELANAFGQAGLDETALIGCQWASVDRRDPLSLATIQDAHATALQKTETLRSAWALREAGVPDDAVQDLVDLNGMDAMDGTGTVGGGP